MVCVFVRSSAHVQKVGIKKRGAVHITATIVTTKIPHCADSASTWPGYITETFHAVMKRKLRIPREVQPDRRPTDHR